MGFVACEANVCTVLSDSHLFLSLSGISSAVFACVLVSRLA